MQPGFCGQTESHSHVFIQLKLQKIKLSNYIKRCLICLRRRLRLWLLRLRRRLQLLRLQLLRLQLQLLCPWPCQLEVLINLLHKEQ